MARRRRRYSGIVSLGGLEDIVSGSISVSDALMGLAAGVVGGLGVKYLINQYAPQSIKDAVNKLGAAVPLAASLSVGAALYYAQGKTASAKAQALGAAGAGAAITLLGYATNFAAKQGVNVAGYGAPAVSLNLSGYNGLLVNNTVAPGSRMPLNGLIVDNNANLSQLGALSMGGDDELGYSDIVALRS